jgi:hypothetical protein
VRPLGIVYRRGHRFYPNTRAFIELMQQGDISSLDKKKRSRLE